MTAGGVAVVCANGVIGGVRFDCLGGAFAVAGLFGVADFACFAV
jgi:hypothetical protein